MNIDDYLEDDELELLVDAKVISKFREKHKFSDSITEQYLDKYIFKSDVSPGTIDLMGYKSVMKSSTEVFDKTGQRVVIIGSLGNGDMVGLIVPSGVVCYINHDELWEAEDKISFSTLSVEVANNVDVYFSMIDDEDCPQDYYEAKENLT